jgi:hypothetical protein
MKKCHSCGETVENIQVTDEEYYCHICLDEEGNPRYKNPVRKSVMNFWQERSSKDEDSKKSAS